MASCRNRLPALISVAWCALAYGQDCAIRIPDDLPAPPYFTPAIIIPDGHNTYVLAPNDSTGVIRVAIGASIYLSCYGNGFTDMDENELKVECLGGTRFKTSNKEYTFGKLSCYDIPTSERQRRNVTSDCQIAGGDVTVDIGFRINSLAKLFTTMEICFNDAKKNVLWSKYRSTRVERHEPGPAPSREFNQLDFYFNLNPNIQTGYVQKKQKDSFSRQTNSTYGEFYFGKNYLNRGHLSANSDFTLLSHRLSTYNYINVAPQWQTFNAGSWADIEDDVRKYAVVHPGLTICTGTHGHLTLPGVKAKKAVTISISLSYFKNKPATSLIPAVPAPKFYWKVIHDPADKKGVAIIGVNNPYELNPEVPANGYQLCDDHASNVTWVRPYGGNLTIGYYYLCQVNDTALLKAIPFLATIDVSGGILQ